MKRRFVTFILTHGRADNVITWDTLKRQGYTGDIILVCDDEDSQLEEYKARFPRVEVFSKAAVAKTMDEACLNPDRRTIVYARNECFKIAKRLGYTHFLELDDDYVDFQYRKPDGRKLLVKSVTSLDALFDAMLDFLDDSGALTVALAQGGDLIGGKDSANYRKRCLRKAMNSFFCRVDNPFKFVGRINEDVNTYVTLGSRGSLFLTPVDAMLVQKQTQAQAGGMSDTYLLDGTYVKSFTTVMMAPSCVRVASMGANARLHHRIWWSDCVPMILDERHRKATKATL